MGDEHEQNIYSFFWLPLLYNPFLLIQKHSTFIDNLDLFSLMLLIKQKQYIMIDHENHHLLLKFINLVYLQFV